MPAPPSYTKDVIFLDPN